MQSVSKLVDANWRRGQRLISRLPAHEVLPQYFPLLDLSSPSVLYEMQIMLKTIAATWKVVQERIPNVYEINVFIPIDFGSGLRV